jgi:hypothetical protein
MNIIGRGSSRLSVVGLIAAFAGAARTHVRAARTHVRAARTSAEIKAHNDEVDLARRLRKQRQGNRFLERLYGGLKARNARRNRLAHR